MIKVNSKENMGKARNRYRLPVPKDALAGVDRTSSPAHIGKLRNAVDFLVPESTPVLAELMVEHDVGVSVEETYKIKKVDTDYFSYDDDVQG